VTATDKGNNEQRQQFSYELRRKQACYAFS